ncbi:uncharacterized protein DEA37_0012653, partial [Paragonimus westermani]
IFFFRPVTQRVAPGSSVHQACGTTNEPVFIEWFQNQQKIGSCLFQSNTTTSSISSMKFKLFIGRQSNRPVCHLAINDAQYEQTGQYTCKTVHANSDGEMASATVLVFTPILDLRLKLENETSLVVDESAYVECVARGGKPLPKLRLQLGGEPVSNVGFAQRTDSPGEGDRLGILVLISRNCFWVLPLD